MNTYKWIYDNNITDDEWNSILKFIKEHRTVYNDVMEAIDETVDYFIQDTIEPDTHFRWNTVEQFKGKLVDITDIYYVPGIDNGVCATVNPIKDIYVTISDIETIESMQDGDIVDNIYFDIFNEDVSFEIMGVQLQDREEIAETLEDEGYTSNDVSVVIFQIEDIIDKFKKEYKRFIKNVSEYLQYFVPIYNMNKSEFKEWAVSSIPNTSITYDDNKNIVEIDVN